MDKTQLLRQAREMRQALLDEGVLNGHFVNMEILEEDDPNFVENIIHTFMTQTNSYLDEMQQTLETKPKDYLETVYRLIQKLKGSSATIGVAKFNMIIEEMWKVYKTKKSNRLYGSYEQVKAGYDTLKRQLEPYAEVLEKLKGDFPPPDEASEIVDMDDVESVDSNNIYMNE